MAVVKVVQVSQPPVQEVLAVEVVAEGVLVLILLAQEITLRQIPIKERLVEQQPQPQARVV